MYLQEQTELKRKSAKLTDYYENLRTNVFSIFGTQTYADSYLGKIKHLVLGHLYRGEGGAGGVTRPQDRNSKRWCVS